MPQRPEAGEMLDTAVALTAGAATLMPFFILSMPGLVALGLLVLPFVAAGAVVAVAVAVVAAVVAPLYLAGRFAWRLRPFRQGSSRTG